MNRRVHFINLFMFILMLWRAVGYQNAKLTAVPETAATGGYILLSCEYTGTGKVSAVSWFNSSNSDAFILTPGSIAPQCDVFLTINTSYDPTRIKCDCDGVRNRYTLRISPLRAVDQNVRWSCTFQDPLPCAVMAEYTIKLTGTKNLSTTTFVTATEENELNPLILLLPALGLLVLIIIIICCVCQYKCHWFARHAASTQVFYREAKGDIVHKWDTGNHIKVEDTTVDFTDPLLHDSSQTNASQGDHGLPYELRQYVAKSKPTK